MPEVTAGSIDAVRPTEPGSVGALPVDEAHAVVHPSQAPQVEEPTPEVHPAPVPSDAKAEGERIAEWKKSLPPEQQKMVDRIITEHGQKSAERLRTLEGQVQRLGWADELSRLASSENPTDRQRAAVLLKATASTLEQLAPPSSSDPLVAADQAAEEIEAYSPAAAVQIRAQARELQALRDQIGKVATTAQTLDDQRADEALNRDIKTLESFAKDNGLPWDETKVLEKAQKENISNIKSAYYATYGEQLIEAGKQAAFKSLQIKQRAALPGSPASPGVSQRAKAKDMMEAFQQAKAAAGVTGDITGR